MSDSLNDLVSRLLSGEIPRRDFIKKAAAVGLSMGAIGSILAACGGAATPAATETAAATGAAASGEAVKIGAIYNMTGNQASIDGIAANGAKLAVKQINAAGGVLGGRPIDMALMDGKTDVTVVSNAATQLIEVDKVVALVGISDTNYALPAGQIAQRSKIPFLITGATAPIITTTTGDYVFLTPFGDNTQAAVAAEWDYKNLGKSAALMLDKAADYCKFLAKYWKERYTELGGTVVSEDVYQTGDTDYSSQITRVKALSPQPDFLFVSSGPDEIGTIVKQVREAGLTLPMMGGDGWDTPLLLELPGPDLADNLYFVTHMGMADNSPLSVKFKEDYKAEYGKELDAVFGALAFDTIGMMAASIDAAGSTDPTAIRDALAKTKDYAGVTGKISYLPGERVPNKSVALIKVVKGKLEFAGEFIPEKVPAP